jgi:gliding motility-associated-like protein
VTYDPNATYGPGTYSVVATIPGGNAGEECTDTQEVTITQPDAVVLTVSHTNVSCNGLADGTITASATPEGAVITVDGVTYDPNATYGPGTYSVVATIPGGNAGEECTDTQEVTITQPDELITEILYEPIECYGQTTTIELLTSGGTPEYTYTFNGITNSTGIFENIGAGIDYPWLVVDANGCEVNGTITLTEPPEIFVDAGEDGEICETDSYQLQGSAENYSSVAWSGGTGTFSNVNDLSAIYTPGSGESGAVTLTLTAYGIGECPDAEDNMILTIYPAPTVFAGEDATVCGDQMYDLDDATASNYETIRWFTSGDGHFNNATVLNTKYTPGESDIVRGFVTLTLFAYGSELCEDASDEMTLFIESEPEVDAGPNATICETDTYFLEFATASDYESLLWSTNGDGSFDDITSLNPIYTPGNSDITAGEVILTITAFGNELCGNASDEMTLSIIESPVVFAGEDATVCETELYELADATADNYTSILWTTSGDGEFSSTTALNPLYAAGANDLVNGNVTLTITATGVGSCGDVSDEMTLSFNSAPVVFAGEDANTCANDAYTLIDATASNYSSILWTTSGDGTFDNETLLNPIYTPGVADISAGSVVLFITAYSGTSCPDVTDEMTLSITLQPDVFAGEDALTCGAVGYELADATADMYESLLWTTSGDGTFSNATILNPIYTPSANDLSEGSVVLTLTAMGSGSCGDAFDEMTLEFIPEPTVYAGEDAETCASDAYVELNNSSASNYISLLWTTSGDGSFNDNTILDPIYTAGANDIAGGQVTLTLTAFAAGNCEDASDEMLLLINVNPVANAGVDQTIQIGTSTTLQGSATGGSGLYAYYWTPEQLLVDPNVQNPITVNLNTNPTMFILQVTDGMSGCFDYDTVLINLENIPQDIVVAVDDYDTTNVNTLSVIDILSNDSYPSDEIPNITICDEPANGTVTINTDGTLTYIPNEDYTGEDVFCYKICDVEQTNLCDSAMVYVYIKEGPAPPDDLIIFNAVTPNGDGMNDTWIIQGIENYPDNRVFIFNRWGDEIHYLEGYDNTRIYWDGKDKKDKVLPDGTYYYVFYIKIDGIEQVFTGWVFMHGAHQQ